MATSNPKPVSTLVFVELAFLAPDVLPFLFVDTPFFLFVLLSILTACFEVPEYMYQELS